MRELEAEGRLTGVMDDRGKYIYISRAEMAAVADFITRRGRVAIAELAAQVQLHGACLWIRIRFRLRFTFTLALPWQKAR